MDNDFSFWYAKNYPTWTPDNLNLDASSSPPSQLSSHTSSQTPTPNRPQGFYPYNPGFHYPQFSLGAGYQPAFSPTFSPAFSPVPPFPQYPSPIGASTPLIPAFQNFSPYQGHDTTGGSHPINNLADDTEEPPEVPSMALGGGGRRGRGEGSRRAVNRGRRGGRGRNISTENRGSNLYTELETSTLARVWVDISEDPITSNNLRANAYWVRIADRYNDVRPEGSLERDSEQLRNHWKRASSLIKLFELQYLEAQRTVASGRSQEDIVAEAFKGFQEVTGKAFRYFDTWQLVRATPKFLAAIGSHEAIKRSKTSIDGSYTTSSERAPTPSSDVTDSGTGCSFRARPEGVKVAKAWGKKKVSSSDEGSTASAALQKLYTLSDTFQLSTAYEIIMRDTSGMTDEARAKHERVVEALIKRVERGD